MKNKKNTFLISALLLIGILVIVNLLAQQFFFRIDLTEDKQYTLSDATKNILNDLEETVTVTAYFSKQIPAQIQQIKNEFREKLVEYQSLSDGNVQFEFLDPADDEAIEREAITEGVQPLMIGVREKDQMVQKRVFMGAIVKYGETYEPIPVISTDTPIEFLLSTSIKKVSSTDKPNIGFISGHGEPSLAEMQQISKAMEVMYQTEQTDLSSPDLSSKYKALVWVNPQDSIAQDDFIALDNYLSGGGKLLIAFNRVDATLEQGQGFALNTGLETYLADKGINVSDEFVVDEICSSIQVVQNRGGFQFLSPVRFPYFPIFSEFGEHPTTKGLEAVAFKFASPIDYEGDSSLVFTPLIYTTEKSGREKAPLRFDLQRKWTLEDLPLKNITVGASIEGNIVGDKPSKIIVYTDGDFIVNGEQKQGQRANRLAPDNINLFVNSLDWLADDTGLIALRTRGITFRPIESLEESTRTTLKYLNFLLPIVLVILYGLYRLQRKKRRRGKRIN